MIGIQIAKTLGASKVIATTRSEGKRELLTSLGADVVIVTSEEDLTEATLAATDGNGVDVVLDHVAGETFAQCLPATAVDGHVVNIGRVAGPASTIDLDALSYRHLTAHGVPFGFSRHFESVPILEDLRPVLLPAAGRGEIRPVIDRTVGIDQFGEVTEVLRSGDAVGKLVMTFA